MKKKECALYKKSFAIQGKDDKQKQKEGKKKIVWKKDNVYVHEE